MNDHTLMCGYDTQVTIHRLKPKTSPAVSAPAKRMPSARPRRNMPKADTQSFSTAIQLSAVQNGST
jgi:hypothetical protein